MLEGEELFPPKVQSRDIEDKFKEEDPRVMNC